MMFPTVATLAGVLVCSSSESAAFSPTRSFAAAAAFAKSGDRSTSLEMTSLSQSESDSCDEGSSIVSRPRRSALIRLSSWCIAAATTTIANPNEIIANAAEFSDSPTSTGVVARDDAGVQQLLSVSPENDPPPQQLSTSPENAPPSTLESQAPSTLESQPPSTLESQAPSTLESQPPSTLETTSKSESPSLLIERPMIKTVLDEDDDEKRPTETEVGVDLINDADNDDIFDNADFRSVITFTGLASAFGLVVNAIDGPEPATPYPERDTAPAPSAGPIPYGLANGRNFYEGVEVNPKPNDTSNDSSVAPVPEPPISDPTPGWKLNVPVPYGIENKGKNPFLEQIEEFCDPGEVKEECTDSIKGYIESIGSTSEVPSKEAATAIASYLDSLSNNVGTATPLINGAGFSTYLDALSPESQSDLTVSRAEAVSGYLDQLGSGNVEVSHEPLFLEYESSSNDTPSEEAAITSSEAEPMPNDEFDSRLTNVEYRVSKLEDSVEKLPDKVFNKLQQWQTQKDEKLIEELRKVVGSLGSQNDLVASQNDRLAP